MACLIIPAISAVVVSSTKKKANKKYHFEWLSGMLWGGSIMLLVDHIISGEIVWYFPFLTTVQDPSAVPGMIKEILVTGSAMTVAIFVVWGMMVVAVNYKERITSSVKTVS